MHDDLTPESDGLIARLRNANPVSESEFSAHDDLAEHLLSEIGQQAGHRSTRTRAIAIALVAAAIGGAATWWFTRPIETPIVTCFAEASLDSNRVGLVEVVAPEAASCIPAWESGILAPDGTAPEVPSLVACVNAEGDLLVFPSDNPNTCDDLGLARVDTESSSTDLDRLAAAIAEIAEWTLKTDCQPMEEARSVFADILEAHGLDAWSVRTAEGQPEFTCATPAVDYEAQQVIVVPSGRAP